MPPRPMPPGVQEMEKTADEIRQKLHSRIDLILNHGSWFCRDCELNCERVESDNGQPATCGRCGSVRIYFVEPLKKKEAV